MLEWGNYSGLYALRVSLGSWQAVIGCACDEMSIGVRVGWHWRQPTIDCGIGPFILSMHRKLRWS